LEPSNEPRAVQIAAEKMIKELTVDCEKPLAALDVALALTKDIQAAYRQANPTQRRLFNQAFFERLEVDGVEISDYKLTKPFAQLLASDLIEEALPDTIPTKEEPETTKPDLLEDASEPAESEIEDEAAHMPEVRVLAGVGAGSQGRQDAITGDLSKVAGYDVATMVELAGIEPATSCMPCRRSPS
jgi:hypothetical protein